MRSPKWEIRHSSASRRIASRRFYSARPSAMKQRKENSNDTTRPNWHFPFSFPLRVFSFFFFFFCFLSNLVLVARCARLLLTIRPASLATRSEKWKAWHSFSLTKATGTLALSFFSSLFFFYPFLPFPFAPPRTSLEEDPGGDARTSLSSNFIRFKYPAKGLKDRKNGASTVISRARVSPLDSELILASSGDVN